MGIEQVIINEETTIKEVLGKLERHKCRIVYVAKNDKLIGSVSEGDIRRFLLHDNDISKKASEIMNSEPKYFLESQQEEIKEAFESTELYSVPIVNYNKEIIGICFRDSFIKKNKEIINVPVVIMAGGKGTRLYPYTKLLPKALVPIGDIPILEHIINRFKEYGCKNFSLVVNHKKSMIKSYMDSVKDGYNVEYVEESEPL